jgi:glyoxylase-like metal-dependent hydrolase (beta-lactamase superfamily II)
MRRRSVTTQALFGTVCLSIAIGLGAMAWAAPATTPQGRVDAAYAAMGGDKIAALKTISLKAHLAQYDPGESYSVHDPDKPGVNSSELIQYRDLARGLTRNEWWDRPKNDDGTRRNYFEVVTPTAGWNVGNDASNGRTPKRAIMVNGVPAHTFSGKRLTVTLRELERLNIVATMKAHPDRVSGIADQTVNGKTYPAVQYRSDFGTFIVMFDPQTNLPARVRTPDWDALEGDSVFDTEFSDWRDVAGTKMPFHLFYTLNGMTICDMTYRDVVANPQIPQNAFDIPADQLAKAAKPADPRITPFHWAIRRTYSAFYMDVDNQYGDEGTKPTIVDIGPYISETQGWTHNTVYIDMGPYLVAMEAPNDDGQSIAHLALKRQKYGDKPIKYLVLSHHHVDHVGGMRQFIAEGATVVVGKGDGDYFRRALARPQTQNWNAPDKSKPYNPMVIENTGKWSIKEGTRELDFFMIDNPHADDMQMGWLPDLKLGLVTDIWNPGPPVTSSNPNLASVVHAVDKLGLKPTKFAGGHGSVGDYAQAEKVVKAAERK